MTTSVLDPTAPRSLRRNAGLLVTAVFVIFAYGIMARRPDSTAVRTLSLVFASIMLEAMPFMLLGSLIGGLIESFVSRERMTSLLPKRGWLTVCLAAGMGILFPVCECAVVPVVRRLARKGLPASAAIAYLLGGPIVNPIVAASTALAYRFDGTVVALRAGLGFAIAVIVALVMGRVFQGKTMFREDMDDPLHDHEKHNHANAAAQPCHMSHGENSVPSPCACGCGHNHGTARDHAPSPFLARLLAAFRHAADDFFAIGHFLVIGAFIAALAQTFVDRKLFIGLSAYPVLPSLMMIALAILLNLCSEADAFIAASFRGLMPLPAQMAFMLIGPMFDLKLLLMYQGVFRRRAIAMLASLILAAVLIAVLGMGIALGGTK
ncbi:MAG TPA: permease [Phycisphaerae bacterium]|nr:permease [Phycisphaerae bacterium]